MSNTQGSFDAQFKVDENHLHSEECNANGNELNSIDRHSGEQVCIEFNTAPDTTLGAIFTVSEPPFLSDVGQVILGNRIVNLDICQLSDDNACKRTSITSLRYSV